MSDPSSTAPNQPSQLLVPETVEPIKPTRYVIVSVDVETTGTKIGFGDMVSVGCATLHLDDGPDYQRRETFYRNIKPLYGRSDQDTMQNFWTKFPDRWRETQQNPTPVAPGQAMQDLTDWVDSLDGRPIFLAWPTTFDFGWIDHYCAATGLSNPFGYKSLDQLSYIAGLLQKPELVIGSRSKGTLSIPESWEGGDNPLQHNALADAIAQRNGFAEVLKAQSNGERLGNSARK